MTAFEIDMAEILDLPIPEPYRPKHPICVRRLILPGDPQWRSSMTSTIPNRHKPGHFRWRMPSPERAAQRRVIAGT